MDCRPPRGDCVTCGAPTDGYYCGCCYRKRPKICCVCQSFVETKIYGEHSCSQECYDRRKQVLESFLQSPSDEGI